MLKILFILISIYLVSCGTDESSSQDVAPIVENEPVENEEEEESTQETETFISYENIEGEYLLNLDKTLTFNCSDGSTASTVIDSFYLELETQEVGVEQSVTGISQSYRYNGRYRETSEYQIDIENKLQEFDGNGDLVYVTRQIMIQIGDDGVLYGLIKVKYVWNDGSSCVGSVEPDSITLR